ncbi:hypothetical protein N2152v2_007759 [Parachlorella kessleri]
MASLTASTKLVAARRVSLRTQDASETLEKVTKIIASQLGTDADKVCALVMDGPPANYWVKPESDFASLGADSLDVVEIIMGLEEEFGIEIDQEDAAKLKDVQAVASYIVEK